MVMTGSSFLGESSREWIPLCEWRFVSESVTGRGLARVQERGGEVYAACGKQRAPDPVSAIGVLHERIQDHWAVRGFERLLPLAAIAVMGRDHDSLLDRDPSEQRAVALGDGHGHARAVEHPVARLAVHALVVRHGDEPGRVAVSIALNPRIDDEGAVVGCGDAEAHRHGVLRTRTMPQPCANQMAGPMGASSILISSLYRAATTS